MRGFNKVILAGNLTRDPELRKTTSGQSVTSFSIATNRVWKNAQTGETQESVDYHNLVAWAGLAETCANYLKKGSAILVEGRLANRSWEAQDGTKRNATEIIINDMNMIGGRPDGAQSSSGSSSAAGAGAYNLDQTTNDPTEGIDIPADDAPAKAAPQSAPQDAPASSDAAVDKADSKVNVDEILDF